MRESDPVVISLLVPSRGRPDRLLGMWESALAFADRPEGLQLVVYLDDDDPTVGEYVQIVPRAVIRIGPRIMLSKMWNVCAALAHGDILWHGNDDVLFRTEHWDTEIRSGFERYADRIACVHGRDGIHDGNMATLGFYSRQWMDVLGYFVPPYFSSDYNDTWLSWVATQAGRRVYLPSVYTEHLHPAVGKGVQDQTHLDRLQRHVQDNVDQLYRDLEPQRKEDVIKILNAIAAAAA